MNVPARSFIFIRHGQTSWNVQGRAQGAADIPLNLTGVLQARRAALKLRRLPIDAIVTSPMDRAAATAALIAEQIDAPIIEEPDLAEVCFGALEGKSHRESPEFSDYWAGRWTPAGAEPLDVFEARVMAGLRKAVARPGLTLVVAHGAVWRRIAVNLKLAAARRMPNAEPIRVLREAGGWRLGPLHL